ncbi:hypothetical protein ZWY2020_028398 [Hordeum vulgare]|nr:hypothetical protein ZWY2020_028398 [Hordeum vulgare]
MEDISTVFKVADKDNSGTLTLKEINDILEDICIRYPQVELYMKSMHMLDIADLIKGGVGDANKESMVVDIEEFKSFVPCRLPSCCATGYYLADCFNKMDHCVEHPEGPLRLTGSGEGHHNFRPFRYKHLGQFAPLGEASRGAPKDWVSMGHSTQWLWYSVYASKQVSWRTRVLVVSDWTRRFIFEGLEPDLGAPVSIPGCKCNAAKPLCTVFDWACKQASKKGRMSVDCSFPVSCQRSHHPFFCCQNVHM